MGNAAAGGSEQEPAEGREGRNSVGAASGMSDPAPTLQKKQPAPPKIPMPPEEELEERFNVVLVSDSTRGKKAHTLTAHESTTIMPWMCFQCQLGFIAGRIRQVHSIQRPACIKVLTSCKYCEHLRFLTHRC